MVKHGRAARVVLDRRLPAPVGRPTLDAEQQAVVDHRDGHLLVLAGPGTGKTTTLAELVVARLTADSDPLPADRVLALTFGRRAARELADRISRRLGGGPLPVVSTFHGFAYGVLRQHADPEAFRSPPRLLTAAEQDIRVRELLQYSDADGRLAWPAELRQALGTRGIAEQVRSLMARARGQGLDGPMLARFGRQGDLPVWTAVGRFFDEYLDTLGFEGVLDYAELMHATVALATKERDGRALREAYRLVVVDEYQDTDPAQVRLLRELARGGAQVVAVGDPDQAIYGFRGADISGIGSFADTFRHPVTGAPARIEVLRTTRRFPEPIVRAASGILRGAPLHGLPADVMRRHRSPHARPGVALVEACTYPSASAEAAGVAEVLLRARAGLDGQPAREWSQMAVLVRNPAVDGPRLARALRAAGIPVTVPADELPLSGEPAVATLVTALSLALDPAGAPSDTARALLAGPIGRVDAVSIRALARSALRERRAVLAERPAGSSGSGLGGSEGEPAPAAEPADVLLTRALAEGRLPGSSARPGPEPTASARADSVTSDGVSGAARAGFVRASAVVAAARRQLEHAATVSEILWAAWTATDWPMRLQTRALGGGPESVGANRDLDALLALFDLADRLPAQRRGRAGLEGFLSELAQLVIPSQSRPEQAAPRDQVQLMSAHRAKGLEWEVVVIAAVQEGAWPGVRLRGDLLHVEELGPRGRLPRRTHSELLAEERRLMYVACTRARSTLVVTAVADRRDAAQQPSRFLSALGVPVREMAGHAAVPLAGPDLVTALRAAAAAPPRRLPDGTLDPEVEVLRQAALTRLAALVLATGTGGPEVAAAALAADPAQWWGVRASTDRHGGPPLAEMSRAQASPTEGSVVEAEASLAPTDVAEPVPAGSGSVAGLPSEIALNPGASAVVRLSPSAVDALLNCPLRWFLERRVRAGTPSGPAATLGVVVHAVAEAVGRGEVEPRLEAITPLIDRIWASMPFAARYQSVGERERIEAIVGAFLRWHLSTGRQIEAVESRFRLTLPSSGGAVGDGVGSIQVDGAIDRVDRDASGSLHLVDFKTGGTVPTIPETERHPQLGIYQLAVREGAVVAPEPSGGGAGDEPADSGPRTGQPGGSALGGAGQPGGSALGGAELVYLSKELAGGLPTVRHQPPLGDGQTWVHDVLAEAAHLASGPGYPARRGKGCASCAFKVMCPAFAPGRVSDEPSAEGAESRAGGRS